MRNLKPKKYLGQHFLIDLSIAQKIVSQSSADRSSQLIEIGPGQGVLTQFLFKQFPSLQVVEVDTDAVDFLQNQFGKNIKIIHEDVLKWDMEKHLSSDAYFIGNLPYNISSPIFFKLLENIQLVQEGIFMIQKEVADRICAPKGNKTYGILSVLIGAYFDRKQLFNVPPSVFRPPPKVTSSVIKISRKAALPEVSFSDLKKVVKTAFNQRRKTLRNALKSLQFQDFPDKAEMFQLRAEQLGIEDFLMLCEKLR